MDKTAKFNLNPAAGALRAKLYACALAVVACYFYLARMNFGASPLVEMNLALCCLVVLLLSLAAAEIFLLTGRVRQHRVELAAVRQREQQMQEQITAQRHHTLNQILRTLLDTLNLNQIPADVLQNIASLFAADLVVIWVSDKQKPGQFICRGVFGLSAHKPEAIAGVPWTFPQFADQPAHTPFVSASPATELTSATHLTFCEKEGIQALVLNPVVRREKLTGIIGVFFRHPVELPAALTEQMDTVTNAIGVAMQAEELYHDLVRMQKIESVGTLASGIAHDFNNVLAAILSCATYCKQHTDPGHPIFRYLEATEASAHRGAALTNQLLSFVRREEPRRQVVHPNEQIDRTLKMLERSLDKSILILRHFTNNIRPIEVDPSMLEQVILNLTVNARDAMPNGGFFTVTTKNIGLHKENPYRPPVSLPDGDYVVLGFRDTGCGMDETTLKRIFEPFFTTKRPGKGTGLGLSLILDIVQNLGGEIRVESKVGVGTAFEIYLPASAKPLPQAAPAQPAMARGGVECILLAEDEDVIREMAQLTLEAKGYKVLAAADGAAALARYRENHDKIDMVIADMAMPRLSGPELFDRMKQINPGVRVIVSSGYSHDQEGQRMLQHGCLGFLQKPYNGEQLCAAVRSILDSGL
ncbi:MAG: Sensor histidine kinase RcsC [Verrucomicrobiae bacterium]|nr:Sensor histidine kinase RcsC [Verrucomicrobiae bacterium]